MCCARIVTPRAVQETLVMAAVAGKCVDVLIYTCMEGYSSLLVYTQCILTKYTFQ